MQCYRDIIRMSATGYSLREIASSASCAPSTAKEVLDRAKAAGLSWPLDEALTDKALRGLLYPEKDRSDPDKCPIDYETVRTELRRRGTTLMLLWQEYADAAASVKMGAYQYSTFCEKYRTWEKRQNRLSLHIDHIAAREIQVDWVGMTGEVHEPDREKPRKVYIFVATLVFSGLIFARGFLKTDESAWITAHIDAFEYFGGTTPIITPDNCKTAVTKHTKDELILNEQYRRMAEHYGTVVIPARPRHPRDKGSIEEVARNVEQRALAPLRGVVFFSLEEFNAALSDKVEAINSGPYKNGASSRKEIFLSQERSLLQPLPPTPYKIVTRARARVQNFYHISFDKRFYSVPFSYVGREVDVVATNDSVSVFCGAERIALHRRSFGPVFSYVTDTSHMPDAHKDFTSWNAARFLNWAQKIGPNTKEVVSAILASHPVEQHAYRSLRALLGLSDKYGAHLLEKTCGLALGRTPSPTYRLVKELIEKHPEDVGDCGADAYVRGSDYYKDL